MSEPSESSRETARMILSRGCSMVREHGGTQSPAIYDVKRAADFIDADKAELVEVCKRVLAAHRACHDYESPQYKSVMGLITRHTPKENSPDA